MHERKWPSDKGRKQQRNGLRCRLYALCIACSPYVPALFVRPPTVALLPYAHGSEKTLGMAGHRLSLLSSWKSQGRPWERRRVCLRRRRPPAGPRLLVGHSSACQADSCSLPGTEGRDVVDRLLNVSTHGCVDANTRSHRWGAAALLRLPDRTQRAKDHPKSPRLTGVRP